MKRYPVVFLPLAENDLSVLFRFIQERSGQEAAANYTDRIEAACLALEKFPERGHRRDDIRAGLRTLAVERRVLIVYRLRKRQVEIVRVFYGGRDYARILTLDEE